jgi:ferredoxin
MKVAVDKELCIGCAVCESVCPDVFEMRDTIAIVKAEIIPEAMEENVKQAVESCPVTAISVQE